jgi:hypothetical protein
MEDYEVARRLRAQMHRPRLPDFERTAGAL